MGSPKNLIELNGKHYDALTGKVFSATARHTKPSVAPMSGINLDGFSPRRKSTPTFRHPAQGVHTKTETSKTLMRTAVKKPRPIVKQARAAKQPGAVPVNSLVGSSNIGERPIDPKRLNRAQRITQSKLIRKFSDGVPRVAGRPAVLPLPVETGPEAALLGQLATHSAKQPFQKALEQANSHRQPRLKKSRLHHRVAHKLHVSPTIISVSASSLAVLLIGGFIAYQNVPNLAMRVASARAGVHASLPGYKPAGFSMSGPIQYKPGQITVNFKSSSGDDRNFAITQIISSWNSETLLENYVSIGNRPYQTYEANGKTIYIYGGSNATWVDGGIWYNVQGNSSLNSDQLLRIAESI